MLRKGLSSIAVSFLGVFIMRNNLLICAVFCLWISSPLTSLFWYSVAVLGTAGLGAEIICGAPCLKFFVNQDYSSSFFVKIFIPQGCIQMFSCDFFSIFSQVRGPFWVTKSAGPGAVAPLAPFAPLKTATAGTITRGLLHNNLHYTFSVIYKVSKQYKGFGPYIHTRDCHDSYFI